jgi:hypothetical protein
MPDHIGIEGEYKHEADDAGDRPRLLGMTSAEAEALCITLYGLLKQYPELFFGLTGSVDDETLAVEVRANDDWPDYDDNCSALRTVNIGDLMFTATHAAALTALGLDENHPVVSEITKAARELMQAQDERDLVPDDKPLDEEGQKEAAQTLTQMMSLAIPVLDKRGYLDLIRLSLVAANTPGKFQGVRDYVQTSNCGSKFGVTPAEIRNVADEVRQEKMKAN